MNVFVTGASGFVGREILRQLHEAGHSIQILARHPASPHSQEAVARFKAKIHPGNVLDAASVEQGMAGADAAIHLVGIISELGENTFESIHTRGTENVVTGARRAGLRRFIQMSALGTRAGAVARYHRSKWAAEEIVRQSGLDWTIFRPSIIYGPDDLFVNFFARLSRRSPVLPVMGDGQSKLQPVPVADVAACFVRSLTESAAAGQTYDLCGREALSFEEVLDAILSVTRRRRWKFHVPMPLARLQARIMEFAFPKLLGKPSPLNRDQLLMLAEDNVGNPEPANSLFGLRPIAFHEGIAAYLKPGAGLMINPPFRSMSTPRLYSGPFFCEITRVNRFLTLGGLLAAQLVLAPALWAGGSGLNVVIIVNQSSSNSVQLGNYFQEQRQIPPQNFLRVNWTGGNIEWAESDLESTLLNPLLTMLTARQLTNQIDYVVLSMDFPYRVTSGSSEPNSTTASLFYGFKADTNPPCSLADGSTNLYFASEGIFRATPPISASSNSFLVTMITGTNLSLAKQVVDQGALGDSTFPTQTVLLGKSFDTARNVRFVEFDNTVFDTRLRGNYSVLRTNLNEPGTATNLLGYENGIVAASVASNAFVAGSMADNLTSFSGDLFEDTGHTTALAFLQGGAAGSYGTVTEPCNYLEKFPSSETFFYQARGFSLAECYYQSLANPYQGILVAEPLAAPFAQPAGGSWIGLGSNAVLSATTNLSLQFIAADALHPVQQVDLFLDGMWLQTVTNSAPRQGTSLNATLNGHLTSYSVPSGATVKSATTGLAAALNNLIYTNLTKVIATAYGDRLELQSTDGTKTGSQVTLSVGSSVSGAPLNTFLAASRSTFLDSIAWGYRTYQITGTPGTSDYFSLTVTKTNNTQISLAVTNSAGGTLTQLLQSLLNLINSTPSLQGNDGLAGEDFQTFAATNVVFNLRALGQGYAAAQIQANISASPGLSVNPSGNGTLTDNLGDLQPRNHIYVTAEHHESRLYFCAEHVRFARWLS